MTRIAKSSEISALLAHPGAELYGSDRVFLDSAKALARRGWTVTVTLPGDGPLSEILAREGIHVVVCRTPVLRKSALRPLGMVRLIADAISSAPQGLALLRRKRPDVVYISTVIIPLWSLLAWILRIPVVCHVHEAETEPPKPLRTLLALPLLTTSRIVTNSEFSRATLLDSLPRLVSRTEVIPNPVIGPPKVTPARADLAGRVNLLFIGRLSPRKGPDVAIRSLAILRGNGVDARLSLLGSVFEGYEWFEKDLHDQVGRLRLTDHVRFLGFAEDVWSTVKGADIVVVPSVADEPFGNTAVEAVLAARPVVASASGGLIEAIRGYTSARSCTPGSAEDLAGAVDSLIGNWPETVEAAIRDAVTAAQRHSPVLYGERLDASLRAADRR
ncbi:MAG: glycosyltransferase [Microthrixaceae bacterium]